MTVYIFYKNIIHVCMLNLNNCMSTDFYYHWGLMNYFLIFHAKYKEDLKFALDKPLFKISK